MSKQEQLQKMKTQPGFVAALDQSGGSTPKALAHYGIKENAWKNDQEMFDLVHQMRTRVITSPAFTGERILGAILFEGTMDRDIAGQATADYLWNVKRVVPFLKVDQGLQAEQDGVQLMKPMPELAALLDKANSKRIFGTKMRSVIKQASPTGIKSVVQQQFEIGEQIIKAGLVPIIEPEVDIHCPQKAKAEALLKDAILEKLNRLADSQLVMLKLTLPDQADFYLDLVRHPRVVRVVALSGGYTQEQANARLRLNHGVVASFSRALLEGLTAQQTDAEFNATLDASIRRIYEASVVKAGPGK
jgi:fructose-bisphosphate aldolase class I